MSASSTQEQSPGRTTPLPEERFWKRYSTHHELPLSSTLSVVLHGLVLALLIFGGYLVVQLGMPDRNQPLSLDAVVVSSVPSPGPSGPGNEPVVGKPGGENPPEPGPQPGPVVPPVSTPTIENPTNDPKFFIPDDPKVGRPVPEGNRFDDLRKDLKGLPTGPGPRAVSGPGTGTGGKAGGKPGGGALSKEQVRRNRWKLTLDTQNGVDYLRQLRSLGATIVFPLPSFDSDHRVTIIQDLAHPNVRTIMVLSAVPEFFWLDKDPASRQSLAMALGLANPPEYFIFFMPKKLESDLRQKEQERYSGPEENIKETHFRLDWTGDRYNLQVVDLMLK